MVTIGCLREESLVGNHEVVEQLLYHLKSMCITLYMHYIIQGCHQTSNVITCGFSPGFEICGTVLAESCIKLRVTFNVQPGETTTWTPVSLRMLTFSKTLLHVPSPKIYGKQGSAEF